MYYVIQSLGLAGSANFGEGSGTGYVKEYDPDAFNGQGDVEFTQDPRKALVFRTELQAMEFAFQTSRKKPFREDGKPNRPLRAFHLTFKPLELK